MLLQNKEMFDICNITKWHEQGITGKGVKIAIFDSRFNTQSRQAQEMFHGKIVGVNGFDDKDKIVSHASSVAHIVHQICPDAMIYCMTPSTENIYWCKENNIDIINVSMTLISRIGFEEALNKFAEQYGWMFSSAGNTDEDYNLGIPAVYENCVGVGAVHLMGVSYAGERIKRATYSSFTKEEKEFIWQMVEIMGFAGVHIYSPKTFDTGYAYPFNGTSAASPWDAGMAGLYRQVLNDADIKMSVNGIRQVMQINAMDLEEEGYDRFTGHGLFVLPEEIPIQEVTPMKREYIILHNTGAWEKDFAQVKNYHLSLGYQDVGYNFGIEYDGKVVQGRSLDIVGAHTRTDNMNSRGIGVVLLGNFHERYLSNGHWIEAKQPTQAQLKSLNNLLKDLMAEHDIPIQKILGHNEVKDAKTNCPGKLLDMDQVRLELILMIIKADVAPFIENGRTFLPVRAIAEALGMSVTWIAETQAIILSGNNQRITLKIGSKEIIKEDLTWKN